MNRGTKKGAAKGGHIKKPKTEIWKWFSKLSLEERGNVLLWEDREGTCLLKQMYKKKATEGEGFFLSGYCPTSVDCSFSISIKKSHLIAQSYS
jgi:hypothetical protein